MPDPVAIALGLPGLIVASVLVGRGLWRRFRPPARMELAASTVIDLPLASGAWQAFNSPASRVPSHGTDWLGQRYAIDLVAVDSRGEHSTVRDWRTVFWLEVPDRFHGFGSLVASPGTGTVVAVYDEAPDRHACRSWIGLGWFLVTSMVRGTIAALSRSPSGLAAVAGNHIIVRLDLGAHAALMHLRRGSALVRTGERVGRRQPLGRVGNSGNSTQPHLHFQLMNGEDARSAPGVPVAFSGCDLLTAGGDWTAGGRVMPVNGQHIRPTSPDGPHTHGPP